MAHRWLESTRQSAIQLLLRRIRGPRAFIRYGSGSGNSGTALPAWSNLKPGTYLIESGTHPSIQGPMGLYGVLRVIDASATNAAYPGVTYD